MNDTRPLLLTVGDDPDVVYMIDQFARTQGFAFIARRGGRQMLAELPALKADVALVDLGNPEFSGLEILGAMRDVDPTCRVILTTASVSSETAIEAVKLGALDCLSKPIDFGRLGDLLGGVHQSLERRRELLAADGELASRFEFCGMIGRSPGIQELFDTIRRLAPRVRTALVTGERGTGKELVARAFHASGPRPDGRFVALDCSTIDESLFGAELFVHDRVEANAGRFELAAGRTVFLDEIGGLPLAMQATLHAAIEDAEAQRAGAAERGRVDVCVIASSSRDLREEVRLGRFRQDLQQRLSVVEIALPPLRERRGDIPCLTAAFVKEFAWRFGKSLLMGVNTGAEHLLQSVDWPGNVRELRSTLERACMLSEGRLLSEAEVLAVLGADARAALAAHPRRAVPIVRTPGISPELNRELVEQALQRVGGNKSAAARVLGVSRRSLYRRLDSFGLR